MSDTMHIENMFTKSAAILSPAETLVRYTISSELKNWIGILPSSIYGSGQNSTPTKSIPNVSYAESIYFGNSITMLSNYAFQSCNSIKSITFPENMTINSYVFRGCYNCRVFDFRKAKSVVGLRTVRSFDSTPSNKEIIVPDSLYDDWIVASNWSSSTNNLVNCIVKASQSSLGPLT